MAVLIFANGDIATTAWIRPYLAEASSLIAVDGGARHLQRLKVAPAVLIGDMDSIKPHLKEELAAVGTRIITHPSAKDETDLELALLYAAAQYDEPIIVFGAVGGRLDQMLGNILLLAHPRLRGRRVELLEEHQRIWLVAAEGDGPSGATTEIDGEVGDIVSLIPLGGAAHIMATTGLRWPLQDEILSFGPARGISNVIESLPASVTLNSGTLFCVHTRGGWER